jgi:HSP20 family protein
MLFHDLMRVSPWEEVDNLRSEMNRLFDRVSHSGAKAYPAVNIWTQDDSVLVSAELPGYDPKDLNLLVVSDELTIKGIRKPIELKADEQFHRQERGYGEFERTVRLPFVVESEKVSARFLNGILTITLPRAEADKPKTISIQ